MRPHQLPDFPWDTLAPYGDRARAHPDGIVDLSVGTPVDPVPQVVQRALVGASDSPGYPWTHGTLALREAAARWLQRRLGVADVTADAILPVIGSKEFVASLPSLLGLGPDDTVVVPSLASSGPPSEFGSWTNNRRSTYYYQHQATVIPDRVILVAGFSKATLQVNDVPDVRTRNSVAGGTRNVNYDENLHRYGIVVNVTKEVALYALDSNTFQPQGNSNTRDINGVLLPAQVGKGQEIGVKTSLMDGKLSATISYYDMELTNVAVLSGNISPITGIAYFTPTGLQKQKGWDGTVAFAPIPEWQLIVTGSNGTVKDQNGVTLNNTYKSMYSFFTRYDFRDGGAKGLSLGGGASKTGGNIFMPGANGLIGGYTFPAGQAVHPITLESVWNATMFASYKFDKKWSIRLNVDNVLDKAFALGAQTPIFVDPSPPRTFTLSTTYQF